MPSARIYHFPHAGHWRPFPPRPPGDVSRPQPTGGFGLLLRATLVTAFLYLSGAVSVARHDILYAGLLAAVWGLYFASGPLLRTRLLGPALARAGQVFGIAAAVTFFGFIYWLVLSR